jgi:predicted phage terminase large subunit-like protein
MAQAELLRRESARSELALRRQARMDLRAFAAAIDVPGRPAMQAPLAAHHALLLSALQRTSETAHGRLMVFMPPGSAKSTYASAVIPAWHLGRRPGARIILASYATSLARQHGRRTRGIILQNTYARLFGTALTRSRSAAESFALSNGSEYLAGGILSGMTGHRAHGLVLDDPVKGRDTAESETIRRRTREAYEDDLKTRLFPGGFIVLVMTRWHEDDLAGGLLPAGWDGESGALACRDGHVWEVLCLPAICDRVDDPLGRRPGETLWPEWFDAGHWAQFQANPRTWSALYQQRPTPDTGAFFKAEWLKPIATLPARDGLYVYGASDYAVTEHGGDYTVHLVVGIDTNGRLHVLDLWRAQASSDAWAAAWCDLVLKWRPLEWAEEGGQIKAGVGPFLLALARQRHAYTFRRAFPARHDKAVRAQAIRGRMAMDGLYLPADAPWRAEFERELLRFPAAVHDDQVDALGLIGQLFDHIQAPRAVMQERTEQPRDWFDEDEDTSSWKTL